MMFAGVEMMGCQGLAVSEEVMAHVVHVESNGNPYAIGVVGGQLARQPKTLSEALATARMLEERGYNYSLGIAQVNRSNLTRYGLDSHEKAFDYCANLTAGSQILAQCYASAGKDWGKAFSCYYSGNFATGYEHGYVQRVFDSMRRDTAHSGTEAIPLVVEPKAKSTRLLKGITPTPMARVEQVFTPQVRAPGDPTPAATAQPVHAPAQRDTAHSPGGGTDDAFVF